MRVGVMVGSDKERPRADRLAGLVEDGQAAEADGFASFWIPQVPGYLDAMTAVALLGHVTDRIEIGTAVVPLQTRHPLILAQQALTTQVACAGRFALGVGPSHHWIISDQLGLPYDRPARLVRDYLDVLDAAFAGPGAVAVDNDSFSVHSPIDVTDAFAMPVLIAALGPTMLRIAGERTGGTILWMADERAIADYVVPRITEAAEAAGRSETRVVAGVPVALCSESRWTPPAPTPATCSGTPTSPRTMSGCSNTVMPKTSATRWPRATNRPCWRACAATATPVSQTSPFGSFRSAVTRANGASRVGALNPSWPRWFRSSLRAHRHP